MCIEYPSYCNLYREVRWSTPGVVSDRTWNMYLVHNSPVYAWRQCRARQISEYTKFSSNSRLTYVVDLVVDVAMSTSLPVPGYDSTAVPRYHGTKDKLIQIYLRLEPLHGDACSAKSFGVLPLIFSTDCSPID
jgi:hypothetical protein